MMRLASTYRLVAASLATLVVLAGCSAVPDANELVPGQASFEVTLSAEGPGRLLLEEFQVDCSDTCSLDVPAGTLLEPSPVANEGASFGNWSGDCDGTGSCSVLVDSDVEIVAVFSEDDGGQSGAGENEDAPDGDGDTGASDDQEGSGDSDGDEDDGPGLDGRYTLSFGPGGTGSGEVEVEAREFVCTGECTLNSLPGETVDLEAVANEGSFFVGWTGACEGSEGVACSLTMDRDMEATALFRLDEKPTLLEVDPVPEGGTVVADGIECGDDGDTCVSDHALGETVELRAFPASEFEFAGWSGACSQSEGTTCEVSMEDDVRLSADFEGLVPMHELTVSIDGNADGEVLFPDGERCGTFDSCARWYPAGSDVTLEATPTGGGYINGWQGTECDRHAISCTIHMDGDRHVVVSFHTSDLEFILRIEKPTGGTIESERLTCGDLGDDCERDFAFDDEVRLEAVPSDGYEFVSWGGDCSGSETDVCDLVFRDSKDVSATFRQQ